MKQLHCFIGGSSQAGTSAGVNTSSSAVTPLAQATAQASTAVGVMIGTSRTLSMLFLCHLNNDNTQCDSDNFPQTTAIADLFELKMFLNKDLHDWQSLGLALGLLYPTLKQIKNDNNDKIDQCKMEMLASWLQQADNVFQKGVPSWSVLKAALKKIGENKLAEKISFDGQL